MMRLNALTIQAFRGIPGKIDLDLRAPITLLYAPNGTGKTTVCDAVEWLLTGTIKRLTASAAQQEIRCAFSPDIIPTVVIGQLEIGGEVVSIERTFENCMWQVGSGRRKKATLAELLAKIAPSAVEDGVHTAHANASRQIWLRGTRFLSGDALSTLLDSDDASVSSRERVFADLLGVGHLLETERQLEAYLGELGQAFRRQQTRVNDKNAAINGRLKTDEAEPAAEHGSLLDSAWEYIRQAHESVGVQLAEEAKGDGSQSMASALVTALRIDLEGRKSAWNAKREAELALAPDWQQRSDLELSVKNDQARLGQLAADETSKSTEIEKVRLQLRDLATALGEASESLKKLKDYERAFFDSEAQLLPILQRYLATPRRSRILGQSGLSLSAARTLLETGANERAATSRLSQLRLLLTELPGLATKRQELVTRQAQSQEALRIAPTPTNIAEVEAGVEAAAAKLLGLRQAYEAASGPVDRLRHLAASVLEHLDHDTSCPVCTYDWKSSSSLHEAISRGAANPPKGLAALETQLRDAEADYERLLAASTAQKQLLAHAVEAQRLALAGENEIQAVTGRVAAAGLNPGDPNLKEAIEEMISLVELLPNLGAYFNALQDLSKEISLTLSEDVSITELKIVIVPALQAAIVSRTKGVEAKQAQRTPLSALEKEFVSAIGNFAAERETLVRRIQQNTSRVQALQVAWQSLAGDQPMTEEVRKDVTSELRKDYERDQQLERIISQASDILLALNEAEELEKLRAELVPLVTERDRLNRYSEAAAAIRDAYKASRNNHIKNQMSEFVRVISALFTRMQANLVFDEVISGEGGAALSWRAVADKLSMDPKSTFSQGQRQDFALAIFLARARGLEGTFMLDEPVNHLDDLNRVALLDVFRAIVLEGNPNLSFVLTTANKPLVRHLVEKFSLVEVHDLSGDVSKKRQALELVGLEGNPRAGVTVLAGDQIGDSP